MIMNSAYLGVLAQFYIFVACLSDAKEIQVA